MQTAIAEPSSFQGQISSNDGACSASGCRAAFREPDMPLDLLLAAAARQGHKVPASLEQQQKLLGKLSHLHLDGLQLEQLHSLRLCPRLQVLYLYDNNLCNISSIRACRMLAHLYCQNNQLTSLDGLQGLSALQKLYVQGNCLACIDCLSAAQHLEELHVSNQRHSSTVGAASCTEQQQQPQQAQQAQQVQQPPSNVPQQQQQRQPLLLINDGCIMRECCTPATPPTPLPGAAASAAATGSSCGLFFEPASLQAIAGSLKVLAAANCSIADPSPLAVLSRLQSLDLSSNAISNMAVLQPILQGLKQLQSLDLRDNPCVHCVSKYRDQVILAAADSLEMLDDDEVTPAHRAFLLALHIRKLRAKPQQDQQQLQLMHCQHQESQHSEEQQQQHPIGSSEYSSQQPAPAVLAMSGAGSGHVAGVVQLSAALQPCRAAGQRPTAAGGFLAPFKKSHASPVPVVTLQMSPGHGACSEASSA